MADLTSKQAFHLTRSEAFTARLQFELCRYASYCQASTQGGVGQAGRPGSKILATRVQSSPGEMAGKIAVSLVTHGDIVAAATVGTEGTDTYDTALSDVQLRSVIEGTWNSGVWDNIV